MKNRIKQIRKNANLTQDEFATKVGSKRNTIANYELGRSEPSSAIFSIICREFGVSEEWLRSGEGEMYVVGSRDNDIERFVESLKLEGDSFKKRLISVLSRLDASSWKVLEQIAEAIYKEELQRQEENSTSSPSDEDFDIEKEVERYRQQLLQEKNQEEGSGASATTA